MGQKVDRVALWLVAVVVGGTALLAKKQLSKKSYRGRGTKYNYLKTSGKGFLGSSYGSVVDGIRCDCAAVTCW